MSLQIHEFQLKREKKICLQAILIFYINYETSSFILLLPFIYLFIYSLFIHLPIYYIARTIVDRIYINSSKNNNFHYT